MEHFFLRLHLDSTVTAAHSGLLDGLLRKTIRIHLYSCPRYLRTNVSHPQLESFDVSLRIGSFVTWRTAQSHKRKNRGRTSGSVSYDNSTLCSRHRRNVRLWYKCATSILPHHYTACTQTLCHGMDLLKHLLKLACMAGFSILIVCADENTFRKGLRPKFNWDRIKFVHAFGDSYSFVYGTQGLANFRYVKMQRPKALILVESTSFIGDALDFSFTPQQLLSNEIVPRSVRANFYSSVTVRFMLICQINRQALRALTGYEQRIYPWKSQMYSEAHTTRLNSWQGASKENLQPARRNFGIFHSQVLTSTETCKV